LQDFQLPRARDIDLPSGDTAYRRASVIDLLLLHTKFHSNGRNFLWMDRRRFETGFIRSNLSKSLPKKLKFIHNVNVERLLLSITPTFRQCDGG